MQLLKAIPKAFALVALLYCCSCSNESALVENVGIDTLVVIGKVRPIDAILGTYTGTSINIDSRPQLIYDSYGNVLDLVVIVDTTYSLDTIRLIEGMTEYTFFVEMSGEKSGCSGGWQEVELTLDESNRYFQKDGYQHYFREEDELIIDTESNTLTSRHYHNTYAENSPPYITNCLFTGARE